MRFLIGYSTNEGQTRKISRAIMLQLANESHTVELLKINDDVSIELLNYHRIILLASVHTGHFQKSMTEFFAANADNLATIPTLFLTVSLAAAGHNAEDWRALDKISNDVYKATGFTPNCTAHIAGAYTPSKYDIFRRFIMRRIIAKEAPSLDLELDHEFTNYAELKTVINEWIDKPN